MSLYTQIQDRRPRTILLKGDSGSGKTHKAAQFPAPVIFNFDNNTAGLAKLPTDIRNGIRIVNPRTSVKNGKPLAGHLVFDNFIEQLGQVVEDDSVQTVVIDSLTTMAELVMDKAVGTSNPSKKVEIQHYGDYSRFLKWFGDEFLANPTLDKNVVVIVHEQLIKDELSQEVLRTLSLVTKIKDQYPLYFSDTWRCFTKVTPKRVIYMVRTVPGVNFGAKCTLDLPDEFEWDTEAESVRKQLTLA